MRLRPGSKSINQDAWLEAGCEVDKSCTVAPFAMIRRGSILEAHVVVDCHAVIGGLPQDLSFDPQTESGVRVGVGTVIREGVTINRATAPGGYTTVGHSCYLMANCHLGHDVKVGDHVVIANGALLGGHVTVGDHCFLSGNAVFHQFIRIGESAIVSGGSRMAHDIPPFVLATERNRARGLNIVGMQRRGLSASEISDVKACYKAVFFHSGDPLSKAEKARQEGLAETDYGRIFLDFFIPSKRGYIRSANKELEEA